jgi:hypothetical protein
MDKTNIRKDLSVDDYVASLGDKQTAKDTLALITILRRISGQEPKLWNAGSIGFGTYHYKYDSGREGDAATISFYPRKNKITVYLMDGTSRHAGLLSGLGKHTTSRVCLYINRLSDIDLNILEQILQQSYDYVHSQNGHMHRVTG